jgi:Putative zinc-finger
MCELSGKLVAWLDQELDVDEMAQVQRHIQDCVECRSQLDACQTVSRKFDAYLDAVVASKPQRRVPRWVPVLSVAASGALAVAIFLGVQHKRPESPFVPVPAIQMAPSTVLREAASVQLPARAVRRRHAVHSPAKNQIATNWTPPEPAIQIAIPAESMFPPGAVPEGINFTADLRIAADGSVQQIRLRPRLIGFERRTTQP